MYCNSIWRLMEKYSSKDKKVTEESKLAQVGKLTFVGTVFIGLGAVLSVYCPPFKRPVDSIEKGIKGSNSALSEVPIIGGVFRDNPLTNNDDVTRFLAVSVFETIVATGAVVGVGAVMKLCGILPKHLEEKIKQWSAKHSDKNDQLEL